MSSFGGQNDAECEQCEWNGGDVKFIGILGANTQATVPDGEFYDPARVITHVAEATEGYTSVGKVRWSGDRGAALAFLEPIQDVQMVS